MRWRYGLGLTEVAGPSGHQGKSNDVGGDFVAACGVLTHGRVRFGY